MFDMQSITHALFPILKAAGLEPPRKQSLDAIASFFGLEREGYDHNALEDALITGECFKELSTLLSRLTYG